MNPQENGHRLLHLLLARLGNQTEPVYETDAQLVGSLAYALRAGLARGVVVPELEQQVRDAIAALTGSA